MSTVDFKTNFWWTRATILFSRPPNCETRASPRESAKHSQTKIGTNASTHKLDGYACRHGRNQEGVCQKFAKPDNIW